MEQKRRKNEKKNKRKPSLVISKNSQPSRTEKHTKFSKAKQNNGGVCIENSRCVYMYIFFILLAPKQTLRAAEQQKPPKKAKKTELTRTGCRNEKSHRTNPTATGFGHEKSLTVYILSGAARWRTRGDFYFYFTSENLVCIHFDS